MPEQREATELKIGNMDLVTPAGAWDLGQMFVVFNMYESLFTNAVSADMMINDSVNLPFKAPFLGEEYLDLRLVSKSIDDDRKDTGLWPGHMPVTAITDRRITKDRQQVYIMHFVSQQAMINANTKISESFRGMLISDIADYIIDEYLNPGDIGGNIGTDEDFEYVVEETVGVENIVIPNWKPFQALNWLAKRAIGNSGVPNYLHWESNGTTFFKSVDSLMNTEHKQEFIFSPVVSRSQVLDDLVKGKTHVSEMKILHQYNTVRNSNNGYYASKLITHDIVKKEIKQHTYDLKKAYAPYISHANSPNEKNFMPLSTNVTDYDVVDRNSYAPQGIGDTQGDMMQTYYDSNISFYPKHDRLYSKSKSDDYDNKVEDWKLKRSTLILGLDQIKLELTFPGLSYLRCGYKIHLVVPSPEKVLESKPGQVSHPEKLYDHFLSGIYLITALKHSVIKRNDGKFDYIMMADVIKDTLLEPPKYNKEG